MKNWIVLSVVSGCLLLSPIAFGQHGRDRAKHHDRAGWHRGGHMLNPRMIERLNLTSEQTESLKSLRFETQKRQIKLRADMALSRTELRQLLSADSPDEAAVMAAIEKAGQAKIALEKTHVEQMLRTRAVIGTEKWQQVKEMKERKRHHRGRGRRHHDRGPKHGMHKGSGPECGR